MTEKLVNGQKVTMTYNPANQLTEMSSDKGSIRYTYDPNGNLTQKQSALGADTYTYDALGRLTGYTGYDSYSQSYQYNAFDLLSEKTSSGNSNRLTQEEYVSGRTLTDPAEQLQNATTSYIWDVTRDFGVLLSETTNGQTTDYDYGFERISALTGSSKTEYLYDPRGSVAAELLYPVAGTSSADSAPNRIEVSSKSYSPFGELLSGKQSGFGYNGETYDAATGALYLRARYYEPALNRFSQKDIDRGTVANPKSLNRYLYTWNNPVSYVDLDGQRVALPLNLGGGSSSKKVPASSPSVPKPVAKCAPVAFQEQPVSTSANRVQQTIKETVTSSTPTITPAMQKQFAAAAIVGAVSNSVITPSSSSLASTPKDQGSSPSLYYSQLSASVTSSVPTNPTCAPGDKKKANYIFFTTGKDSDFSKQAEYQHQKFASKGEDATMVKVDTREDFERAWNDLPDSVDQLIIISHSNGTALILQEGSFTEALSVNGENSLKEKIGKITELSPKNIDTLEIIACNSGNLTLADTEEGNIAQAFLKIDGIDTVIAYDGNVGFGDTKFPGVLFSKLFGINLYPRQSTDQTRFEDILQKYHKKQKSPAGKVIYAKDGTAILGWE